MPIFRGSQNATISTGDIVATQADIAAAVTLAEQAQAAAEAAQAAAETSLDDFDDRYLGAKSSNPTVDNDGDALIDGALYYNTTEDVIRVYDLSSDTWSDIKPSATEQANINAVAPIASQVETVSDNISDVTTVAGVSTDVSTVAGVSTDVTSVAAIGTDVTAVSGITADVTSVAAVDTDVSAVAGITSDVTTVAANIVDIQNADQNAQDAEAAKIAAESAFDSFDDRYLGAKSSEPTVDNDGDALLTGALYYDTTLSLLRVYTGSVWASIDYDPTNVAITGGNIDGTAIGETTPSTGDFTTVNADAVVVPGELLMPVNGEILWPVDLTVPDNFFDTSLRLFTAPNERAVIAATPAGLFTNGKDGAWLEPSPTTTYTDTSGTTAATVGDAVARIDDLSGNDNHATQATSAARPLLAATPDRVTFDLVDDNFSMDFTGSGGFTATLLQGSDEGIVHAKVSVPDGAYSITQDESYFPSDNITGLFLVEGDIAANAVPSVKNYLVGKGAGADFAGVTSMESWFKERDDLIELYANDWDVSSVTDFRNFAERADITVLNVSNWDTSSVITFLQFVDNCSSLTTLDVSNWDTSSVTSFDRFAQRCSSLTTLDVSNWDTSSVTDFNSFARNCSSLTALGVSNWDTSSVTSFRRFAAGCGNLTTLDVSNWDTSSVTSFRDFAISCGNLTTLDVSNWDTSSVTNFSNFARSTDISVLDVSNWDTFSVTNFSDFVRNCSSLTALDVSNWDTSSVTNFSRFTLDASSLTTVTVTGGTGNPFADSPCTNYEEAFTNTNLTQQSIDDILVAIEAANTSNGTFDQSGGNAPSATGEAAIDDLRSRGWTVTVEGGY